MNESRIVGQLLISKVRLIICKVDVLENSPATKNGTMMLGR